MQPLANLSLRCIPSSRTFGRHRHTESYKPIIITHKKVAININGYRPSGYNICLLHAPFGLDGKTWAGVV